MGLNVGDPIPVVDIPLRVGDEFTTINTGEISKGKRIVIFALPMHIYTNLFDSTINKLRGKLR